MFPTTTTTHIMLAAAPDDESDDVLPPSWIHPGPLFAVYNPVEMEDLALSLQDLTFDMEAIGRELLHCQTRDTDQIRQDFIRNGIDTSLVGKRPRRAPPGFETVGYGGPLANLENRQTAAVVPRNVSEDDEAMTSVGRVRKPPRRKHKENEDYCVFCFNNHEPEHVYLGHSLHDDRGVQCPRLRQYVCPYCHATDRNAHTKKYCPSKPIITPEDLAMQQQQQQPSQQQKPPGTTTVSARVVASATASIRACQPSVTPGGGGGKRALRF